MSLKECVNSILIVSSSKNFNTSFLSLLPKNKYSPVAIATSVTHARQQLADTAYDFVIINSPLPDDFGRNLAIELSYMEKTIILLLVKNDLYDETFAKVSEHGVLTLQKPLSKPTVLQALDWMCTIKKRLEKAETKTLNLEKRMSEIRLVNRAKWLLIEHQSMSENDAHKYLEKQAMDLCTSKKEIAEKIIDHYA